jgi:hypothetical protein
MTGTDLCVNKPHKSRSYLNHLVPPAHKVVSETVSASAERSLSTNKLIPKSSQYYMLKSCLLHPLSCKLWLPLLLLKNWFLGSLETCFPIYIAVCSQRNEIPRCNSFFISNSISSSASIIRRLRCIKLQTALEYEWLK